MFCLRFKERVKYFLNRIKSLEMNYVEVKVIDFVYRYLLTFRICDMDTFPGIFLRKKLNTFWVTDELRKS